MGSTHRHIDEGLHHHRVRSVDGRQFRIHRAQGHRGFLDRRHGAVVPAFLVSPRINGRFRPRGRVGPGALVSPVPEERRGSHRHAADLDLRVRGKINARIDGLGSLQVPEAHHVRLPGQNVHLDLAARWRCGVGPRQHRGHLGGEGRENQQRHRSGLDGDGVHKWWLTSGFSRTGGAPAPANQGCNTMLRLFLFHRSFAKPAPNWAG